MMDSRERQSLDNYITGHYGEDQFREAWDNLSGHEAAFSANPMAGVFTYDTADDGPECEVITRILAHHPLYRPGDELGHLRFCKFVDDTARKLFKRRYGRLSPARKAIIRAAVCRAKALGKAVC